MSRFNEAESRFIEEHFFSFVWSYTMFARDFVRNLGQPDKIINKHLLKQLKLDRQILLRVLAKVVEHLHTFRRKIVDV